MAKCKSATEDYVLFKNNFTNKMNTNLMEYSWVESEDQYVEHRQIKIYKYKISQHSKSTVI